MELGIYSFGDNTIDPIGKTKLTNQQRMKNLLEEIALAEEVGLDVFGLGEHHRDEYIISSPVVALAAAAAITKRIRLTSAVTVLSSDDPVRVFQDFAQLDLVSNGRAEIMAGRGSFIESFPLFGFDLDDYNELFEEKLELLLKIRESEKISWDGLHRASIDDLGIYPRPVQNPLPVWVAVGGHPNSVVRAGRLGLPLALAIIGGRPGQFVPLIELYRKTLKENNFDPQQFPVSINSHGFIAETKQEALDDYYPYYEHIMNIIGKERGWPPATRSSFEASCESGGALLVGSPSEVAEKIIYEHDIFQNDRFLLQISISTMPHEKVMKSIELFGTKVAPIVRDHIQKKKNKS